ncbi:DUF262 domain-containing protein [Mycoplasma crocodyli]|uniref:GmrSD restriction endonucleases N-terminal domain-containing protein n=1 Tax=Mycoplasma crocodyli (strain ATCC 51981 / MP145) TaxID=512564 RepID=D5E5J7_MYCCM|nr:DUF262 domain-containing protein [Mycoplasma crocodyli]ADE19766.1 hypothetical protein MCRO_0408 [Mycoplasma crocodyli MP145]
MKQEFVKLKKIFEKYKVINIPYYQRDYVWGTKNEGRNLYKFIDDIISQYKDDSSKDYFIGTLAFCSDEVYDVIDGQQRLTSLILFLTILANSKCSLETKNKNDTLINPGGKFVIQEEHYLTEELKHFFGLPNSYNSQLDKVNIPITGDKIKKQINMIGTKKVEWFDGLYNYILDNIKFISIEYNNIGESLKYFLNINSLSIQLSQSEIFYSILSQSLRISNSLKSIFSIKKKISELADNNGISKDFEFYNKSNYEKDDKKGIDNIIYIFLRTYYKEDENINYLSSAGIGKWMSFYKNEVFKDQIKAKEFVERFNDYLNDFEIIYQYITNVQSISNYNEAIHLSSVLIKYENYSYILKIMQQIFLSRHNYKDKYNLYEDNNKISLKKLNEICTRLNLTKFRNYMKNDNKNILEWFDEYIEIDENGQFKKTIDDIKNDIEIEQIFNLNYKDKNYVSTEGGTKEDNSRKIKVVLGVQEAILNYIAEPKNNISSYLASILLSNSFDIEHLYSVNEFRDKNRLEYWKNEKNKFLKDEDFDIERFSFENLSILSSSLNRSASEKIMSEKLKLYAQGRTVLNEYSEYLIQSLVENSEYYKNENIKALNLPKRTIEKGNYNTWEHSKNNRDFNIKLIEIAIDEIAKK